MKTKFKRISKRSLATVLVFLMIFSTLMVGTISTSNAATVTNLNRVKFHANLTGYTGSGASMSAWSNQSLTNADNNHYYGTFYTAANQYQKQFGWNVGGSNWGDSWCTMNGEHFTATQTYEKTKDMTFNGSNDKVSTITATSGWVKLQIDWYGNYSNSSYVKFYQTAVSALSSSVTVGSSTLTMGGTTTVTPSSSGGTGTPTNSVKVYQGSASGTDVTSSVLSGTTFTAPTVTSATTYYIVNTATDPTIKSYTKASSAKTITVNPASYTITYKDKGNVAFSGTHASGYPTTYTYGTGATLKSATKDGYTFGGWFDNSSCTGTAVTSIGTSATGNKTYYAKWTQNTYAITLSETGGSGTMKIDGTTRSSGYAVTHGSHTFRVDAPSGYVIDSISGIGTWTNNGSYATLGSTSITAAKTISVTYVADGRPSLDAIADVSKDANTTTFNVTANISDEDKKTGTLSATASSGTTSVATVGTPTVSGSTVTIPVTIKGVVGSSTISVTLKDGSTTLNTQTFSVSMAEPTFTIEDKDVYVSSSGVDGGSITNGGVAPTSIAYTSSNTTYITVGDSDGKLTVVKVPSAKQTSTITATATYASGYTKTTTYTATLKKPTLTASSSATSGNIGDTATGSCSGGYPSLATNTVKSYKWTSNASTVVSITNDTTATPTFNFLKNGSATITLTVTYKNTNLTKTATTSITVNAPTITVDNKTGLKIGESYTPSPTLTNPSSIGSGWTVVYTKTSGTATTLSGSSITGDTYNTTGDIYKASYQYNGSEKASTTFTVKTAEPTVSMSGKTVAKGDSVTFSATTSNPSGLTIEYAVNPAVANVSIDSSTGVVTVEKACTASSATITASAKNSSGTVVATKNATLTIVDPQLVVKNGSTTLNSTSTVYMTKGGSDITLDTSATNFSDQLYFKSNNTAIATVGKTTGVIHAEAKGTTTITVANWDLDTRAVGDQSLTFTVNVSEADTNHYVYFSNGGNWSSPTIHAWGNGTVADRQAMTKIGVNDLGQDVYAYKFSSTDWAKVKNIHFLSSAGATWNGSSDDNNTHTFTGNELSHTGFYNDGTYDLTIVKPQITANNVTIDMGSTQTMTATVLNNVTPSTFNWSSGTTSIATTASTTTASNVISGVAPGTSTITVKAYAAKPSGWNSIVTDGTADDYVAGTATATATVVAENKTVTFGAKKTDDGSTFTDLSGAVTAKYYDADTSGSGSSGSGSGSDPEPAGGPYYLHIGRQNDFVTNEAIEFTWNGSYYYAEYTVETANTDYPFVINTKNTALGDSDKSASSQAVTTRAANYDPDNIYNNVFNYLGDYDTYSGYGAFKIIAKNANTKIYITFASTSAGVVYRSSITSSSGSSGGSSGSSGTSGEGTTMTSPQSVPYGKVAVFTAEATKTVSDVTYHFAEWVDGSGNKLSSDTPYQITVTADKTVYARYYKVFKLSAFDSYEKVNGTVNFVTAPPKTITVKHGTDTYTYNYDGTAPGGHPGTPDDPSATYPDPLPVNSGGTYGQGNYIQYLAGDEITLHYSAMSSSEIFKGVFYNNSTDYYVAKPTAEGFIAHDYTAEHTLYMNSAYYASVPSGLPTTTVDNDDHTIKFTGTKDFKNIDVEMATKRKVYFSDYTNAIIGSKNIDDYYYDGEALSVTGDQLTVKAAM